jgi:23S rRNA (cytidine1920-2'-O)/16S rRNA (cytidine1409-2'-O)-methyltransferase
VASISTAHLPHCLWRHGGEGIVAKVRADQLLLARGLAESRTRAQALIMGGKVFAGDRAVAKPGDQLPEDCELTVKGRDHPWVSRGGIKLAHGLDHFGFGVTGTIALDVGSSTGGFTDVLLARGAAKVYAIDVGTNQLAWKLRQDPRVIVHEQTNARDLTREIIPEPIDIVVCDASFIGLAKVLPAALSLARPGGLLVALVKPQFEAGRAEVGKGGVVRDEAVRQRVCDEASAWVAGQGWRVLGIEPSPITGPEGNVEFLLGAVKERDDD